MKFVVLFSILMATFGISVIFRRKCENNAGRNIGEKHMKEQWGIEDNREYHE